MPRVAVFVDAGYLIARGAEALTGAAGGRRGVILHETRVISDLIAFAEAKARRPGEILRVYWYDAARAQPTAEHIRLAELDDVKLRLGTLNSVGQQKGVDSLIIADMIELSRNHACDSFLLVGGDEDLRVGVQVAQTYGIRVHLLGVDIDHFRAQSPFLVREVDTNSGWTAAEVANFLGIRPIPPEAAPIIPPDQPAVVVQAPLIAGGAPSHAHTAAVHVLLERVARDIYEMLTETDLDDIRAVFDGESEHSSALRWAFTSPLRGRTRPSSRCTGKARNAPHLHSVDRSGCPSRSRNCDVRVVRPTDVLGQLTNCRSLL